MPESDTPEAKHEQSETFQDQSGRWQNYYGGVPGMGLRIPLEHGTSYGTSGEADAAAQIRSDMFPPQLEPREAPAPPAAPAPSSDFKSLAERLTGMIPTPPTTEEVNAARIKSSEARERAAKNAASFADIQGPQIDAAKKEGQAFAEDAARRAPQPPGLAAPPSRGLRPFLQPTDEEPPEKSIGKLMQSISLFATMIGGGRAGARASLSAMTGALEGWKAGDRERADRAFADWKAQTDTMLKAWESELAGYETWLKAAGLPVEQRMAGLRLEAMRRGNVALAEKLASDDAATALRELEERQKTAISLTTDLAKLTSAKELADEKLEMLRKHQHEIFQLNLKLAEAKLTKAQASAEVGLSDDALEDLATSVADGASMASLGPLARGTSAKFAIQNRAAAIRRERGDEPGAVAMQSANYRANTQEQAAIQRQRGLVLSFIETFDRNLEVALKLSKEVDRTGRPVLDSWILAGRKKTGDPKVAAFDTAVFTVTQEYGKISSGSTTGDVASREHAASLLTSAMSPEQFEAVGKVLKRDSHNRAEGYQARIEALQKANRGGPPKAVTPPGESKTITLPDGTTVTVTP